MEISSQNERIMSVLKAEPELSAVDDYVTHGAKIKGLGVAKDIMFLIMHLRPHVTYISVHCICKEYLLYVQYLLHQDLRRCYVVDLVRRSKLVLFIIHLLTRKLDRTPDGKRHALRNTVQYIYLFYFIWYKKQQWKNHIF